MLLFCSIFSAPRERHSATRENFDISSQVSFHHRPNPGDPEHVRAQNFNEIFLSKKHKSRRQNLYDPSCDHWQEKSEWFHLKGLKQRSVLPLCVSVGLLACLCAFIFTNKLYYFLWDRKSEQPDNRHRGSVQQSYTLAFVSKQILHT